MSLGRHWACKLSVVEPWAFEWLLLLPDTCDSGSQRSWAHGTCMLQDRLSHLTCDTAILKTTPFLHKANWEWNCMFKHLEAYWRYIRQGGAVSIWTKVSHLLSLLRYSPGAFASVRPCSGGRMPGQGSPDLFGDIWSIDGRMVDGLVCWTHRSSTFRIQVVTSVGPGDAMLLEFGDAGTGSSDVDCSDAHVPSVDVLKSQDGRFERILHLVVVIRMIPMNC